MKNYTYKNDLIGKKQLRQLLAWSFTNYDSMQACLLADELKYLGFKYASQAGISISIEDLKIPFVKNLMLEKATQEIVNSEKIYLKGKITEVERFQKIIDTWSLTSEALKEQVIFYFKNYDPLNSVYIMAFSGARGNLSQVRQLVGMRGLMSDPSGEIMNLPIKKNFREGLTITDYLMSGYGARKGIVDTALKTANSGYLTRRLIDVGQDILIREKDCLTSHSFLLQLDSLNPNLTYEKLLGRVLAKPLYDPKTGIVIISAKTIVTPKHIETIKSYCLNQFYVRSPLTCKLYRSICQKCYGWDLANENLVDIGEAVGILAGQSIGEPGTQLTMRTFHTGGIFTSEARQQIISPVNGIIRFYKILKTVLLRTNSGEDVLITKNSGSILLLPEDKKQKSIEIEISRNTILFPKNNQYIAKDTVIGELLNTNKQIKTEVKPILSDYCGEIFIPRLKKKVNFINNNKLIWILSGKLYNGPKNSFINFSADFKLNRNSYIFRTKLINHYKASVEFIDSKKNLYQKLVRSSHSIYLLSNSSFKKLAVDVQHKDFMLTIRKQSYLVKVQQKNNKFYLQLTRNNQIGNLISNNFKTLTGGTVYYNYSNISTLPYKKNSINYIRRNSLQTNYNSLVLQKTILWLGEETHRVNCELNLLLVEHGDFISKNFELVPGIFSKTSGIISIRQKNDIVYTISIKSGLVYQGKQFKTSTKKLYYPGELLASSIPIRRLSFCETILINTKEHFLVRPVILYEIPVSSNLEHEFVNCVDFSSYDHLKAKIIYSYKSGQRVKGIQNVNLATNILSFNGLPLLNSDISLELLYNQNLQTIQLKIKDKIRFNNYLLPSLRYNNIESCFLAQKNQFIDWYCVLGYLESIISNSLEIVKFKVKNKDLKQILLISNKDCFTLPKNQIAEKAFDDFVINSEDIHKTGKIIIEGKDTLTLQKGRPYFFPNCTNQKLTNSTNVQYKIISANRIFPKLKTNRNVSLNYHNVAIKFKSKKAVNSKILMDQQIRIETEFSKLFFKKNGKLFSSLIPKFLKTFSINSLETDLRQKAIMRSENNPEFNLSKFNRTLLVQSSQFITNKYKSKSFADTKLTLVKFLEYPFLKSTKSIGVYSITEDYFEQEVNSVFCKNTSFIEEGETLGLLKLEKEITGDIVQGLPRIEEILETRKKNLVFSKIPTSQKKGLLIQKSSLDINFEFKKLGTTIKETDRINPHKLLKTYFNYYGIIKCLTCNKLKQVRYSRLVNNYEGSYKSFKKVQSFILNSVQSVYQSQGVTINDKHLEVIIKQMTTKVLITYEGNTPILRREVIDLYHIKYINKIVEAQKKQPACYIPLLLGITKAALNNPSFISAASFQETTRILTVAAIEGRIDWLRGLKENIIIGHLIPAGTGSQNYKNTFVKSY